MSFSVCELWWYFVLSSVFRAERVQYTTFLTSANVLLYRPWRRCRVFVPLKSSELRSRLHMERRRRIQALHLQHNKLPCELLERRDECRYFDMQKV